MRQSESMKPIIINKSKASDESVKAIVKAAMRFTKCKGVVPVVVRHTRYHGSHGVAYYTQGVNMNSLIDKTGIKVVWVDGGYIEVWFNGSSNTDALRRSETFFKVLCHEFCHIRDFQDGKYIGHKIGSRHDSRPCELAVDNRMFEIRGIVNYWNDNWSMPENAQEAILNFGIALETPITKARKTKPKSNYKGVRCLKELKEEIEL